MEEPTIVAARITPCAITTAKFSDFSDDPELRELADQTKRLLEAQDEYFARYPVLRLLRWLGWLPDPCMPVCGCAFRIRLDRGRSRGKG